MPAETEVPVDIFLSYSHTDLGAVTTLRELLKAELATVFKDDESIHSGDDWLAKLESAVSSCQAFVVLVGAQGVRRWVGAEVKVALVRHIGAHDDAKRLPIHPILLGDTLPETLPPFLAAFQATRWSPGAPLPPGLAVALRRRALNYTKQVQIEGCPFMGLARFGSQQAHLYFGRRQETLDALAGLGVQQERHPDRARHSGGPYLRWLQVEGHSGSGKSSLVRAGLLPMVERGAMWPRTGFEHWQVLGPLMPGKAPVERLAEEIERRLHPDAPQALKRTEDFMADPRALALHLRGLKRDDTAWLLVVDQFEELYALSEESQRLAFDASLAHALQDADCPLFLVSTVRSDFAHRITEGLPRLAALVNSGCKRFLLPQISTAGLQEAIEMPAQLASVDVRQVSTAMQRDAEGEPGALPLVENALRVLWHEAAGQSNASGKRVLSGQTYRDRGGLAGLLATEADALLALCERKHTGGEKAALELLLRLTHISPDGRHTRQRITREDAIAVAGQGDRKLGETVLHLLAGARDLDRPSDAPAETLALVVTSSDRDPQAEPETPARSVASSLDHVDLIHETLLRRRPPSGRVAGLAAGQGKATGAEGYWPTMLRYVEANRDRPVLQQQLDWQIQHFERGSRYTRWFRVAWWGELANYRLLPVAPASREGRFLVLSRRVTRGAAALALVTTVVGVVWIEGALWAKEFQLPQTYVLVKLQWLLGLPFGLGPMPEMVDIPAPAGGSFEMGCKQGSDDPRIEVYDIDRKAAGEIKKTIQLDCKFMPVAKPQAMPRGFKMAATELTFLQYDYYVWRSNLFSARGRTASAESRPEYPPDKGGWGRFDRPVINVSARDAEAYALWLTEETRQTFGVGWMSRLFRPDDGAPYRLPTEAEWEYAARRGNQPGAFPWGSDSPVGRANCADCGALDPSSARSDRTLPVRSFKPAGGLYDMAGNVWEWTADRSDPNDKDANAARVLRGGSWYYFARNLRVANRNAYDPDFANLDIGFRVCRASPIEPLPAGGLDAVSPRR